MTTNIGNLDDPFYRYKRPMAQIDNKNGKTVITNIDIIAKSLHTKSSYMLYYIQLEKSTSITKGEIKMNLSKQEIEKLLNDFINKYILCNICNYPELIIQQSPNKQLYFSCNACGHTIDLPENKFTKIIYKDYK